MKIFISQPMKGYSNFEIEIIRGKIKEALKEKYGNDIEIIDSFIKGAPANAKPLWYLGESLKRLSTANIAVFAYNTPEFGDKIALARDCDREEKCAREYDTLCLYVAFYKNSFKSDVNIELSKLSTQRPDFVDWWNELHRSLGKTKWEEGQAAGCDASLI